MGRSALIDLDDPRLRLKASSLTQLARDDRACALSIYLYIKRLTLRKRIRSKLWTARDIMEEGCGDAANKATLFVALLRSAGIAARIRFGDRQAAGCAGPHRAGRPGGVQ